MSEQPHSPYPVADPMNFYPVLPLLVVVPAICLHAEAPAVSAGVHAWDRSPVDASSGVQLRRICSGSANTLELFEVTGRTLSAGQKAPGAASDDDERILIVKEGTLQAEVAGQSRSLAREAWSW